MKTKRGQALQSIMLPHLVCNSLWVQYQSHWQSCFLPQGKAGLATFWEKFQHHPSMKGHCLLDQDHWMSTTIPCQQLGAARSGPSSSSAAVGQGSCHMIPPSRGPFSSMEHLAYNLSPALCFSRGLLLYVTLTHRITLCHRITFVKRTAIKFIPGFWASQVYEQLLVHGNDATSTLHNFFEILKWSFGCLLSGVFPDRTWTGEKHLGWHFFVLANVGFGVTSVRFLVFGFSHICTRYSPGSEDFLRAGKPICGGYRLALVSVQGDLDFFAASLGLPRWSLAAGGCPVCKCKGSGPLSWKKFYPPEHITEMEWEPQE